MPGYYSQPPAQPMGQIPFFAPAAPAPPYSFGGAGAYLSGGAPPGRGAYPIQLGGPAPLVSANGGSVTYQTGEMPDPADLQQRGVRNVLPILPLSPKVKCLATGMLYIWHQMWARRPELFVNCDEYGNEDPAAWMGRGPDGFIGDGRPRRGSAHKQFPLFAPPRAVPNQVVGLKFTPPNV